MVGPWWYHTGTSVPLVRNLPFSLLRMLMQNGLPALSRTKRRADWGRGQSGDQSPPRATERHTRCPNRLPTADFRLELSTETPVTGQGVRPRHSLAIDWARLALPSTNNWPRANASEPQAIGTADRALAAQGALGAYCGGGSMGDSCFGHLRGRRLEPARQIRHLG